ncbi:MAG TPA: hypothetical protein VJ842_10905 [Pyrinomonadaceae bacterium]|nr:hypothetical protein [Pyrinomonadaceae bacterium]
MKFKLSHVVLAAFVLLSASPAAHAQESVTTTPPPLEISDPQWLYLSVRESSNFPNTAPSGDADGLMTSTTAATHAVSALFHNTGTKTVKSVTWEYVFFKDEQRTRVEKRHTFRGKQEIRPGAAVRLKNFSYRPRPTEYSAARVLRVDYADGTSWRADK